MAIDLLAVCLVAQEDFARAAGLCGAGDAFWKMLHAPIQQGPYYAEIRRSAAETCRQALGDERFESYRQRGLELSVAERSRWPGTRCRSRPTRSPPTR
jgi:hypothetical protein